MSKFRLLVLCMLLCCVCFLCGCSGDNPYVDSWNEGIAIGESQFAADQAFRDEFVTEYFVKVGEDSRFSFILYRDILTDVMYVSFTGSAYSARGAALSVMYAADGSPLLYSEWLALKTEQEGN